MGTLGKISAVIGKDIGENHVDINLNETPYAAMIDVEHAVLNYADGNWYIEDLDSKNGISIQKVGQDKAYKLSALQPCKLDFGDIIFIGVCQLAKIIKFTSAKILSGAQMIWIFRFWAITEFHAETTPFLFTTRKSTKQFCCRAIQTALFTTTTRLYTRRLF